ncbi:MAG: RhuM family protein [Bacteroidales bacterium]|nr:RhuM family protein [Bacteroidales bacterium]
MNNEIIIYQSEGLSTKLEVKVGNETVWLNRQQISTLFDRDVKTIGKHISSIFKEGELEKVSTVANFATVQDEGGRMVERQIEHYDLDVIISIGYRVKSKRGTQFRIWANKILKEYLLRGHVADRRITFLENEMKEVKTKLNEIDFQVNMNLPQNEGIFYNGQVYDAYIFVSDLIKSAKNTIVLVDNYVDDSVLTMLSKRNKNVLAIIYTSKISKQFSLDLNKYNKQYQKILYRN